LKEHNVKESNIKFELFATLPKRNRKIIRRPFKITIMVDDEERLLKCHKKQTVLDAALKQGIDAPYPSKEFAAAAWLVLLLNS
jgi:ring-1,2-phenylacetyl-CoA epoxidase subunit PaaE